MSDLWIPRIVAVALAMCAFSSVVVIGILGADQREIPPALAALGGTSIGALASILVAPRRNGGGPHAP